MKNKQKLDEFHYHEALDRTYVLINIIENELKSHPVITKHKILKTKVKLAQKHLLDLYQLIGKRNNSQWKKQSSMV